MENGNVNENEINENEINETNESNDLNQEQNEQNEQSQQEILEIRYPKWNNVNHTSFDIELHHPEYGWIPFTVTSNDTSHFNSVIWDSRENLNIQEYTETIDIDALKEQKHQELRSERDKLRQIEFAIYNNANYQVRQEDQDNMNTFLTNAIGMLSGIMSRENFGIMDADNILRTLTPEQIVELGLVMKTKVEEIYARYWYARDVLLKNASTKEEIQGITIL